MDRSNDARAELLRAKVSLPQYRRSLFDGRTFFFAVLIVACTAASIFVQLHVVPGQKEGASWTDLQQREFANKLREFVPERSAAEFETYLAMSSATGRDRANIYYTIAKTAVETGEFESALAYFYKAEIAEPDGPLAADIGTGIVRCLEELGQFVDAQSALGSRAELGARDETAKRGDVVARIGAREITAGEIDRAIQKMPPRVQQQYASPEKKNEFLNQFVAEELLYEKALRRQIDKNPEVRARVEQAARRAAVEILIQQDVRDKVQVTPEDVRMYYDANMDEFREKARANVRRVVTDDEAGAQDVLAELATGTSFEQIAKQGVTEESGSSVEPVWVVEGGSVPGIADSESMVDTILAAQQGTATAPIEQDGGWYVFYIEEKTEARQRPFDEVKKVAEQRYRSMKEQEEYKRLLDTTLQANNVQLFPEKLDAGS